jgi:hypothetical protein
MIRANKVFYFVLKWFMISCVYSCTWRELSSMTTILSNNNADTQANTPAYSFVANTWNAIDCELPNNFTAHL